MDTIMILGSKSRKLVQDGSRRTIKPIMACNRFQSTCTMDLVSMDESVNRNCRISSTVQFSVSERDYSALARRRLQQDHTTQWKFLMHTAMQENKRNNDYPFISDAEELDLVDASERLHLFDKILLLLNHGEFTHQTNGQDNVDQKASVALTGKGIGQALTLSRRTALFCNVETGLIPQLVVVEPSFSSVQTAFLSFPYDTPHSSLHGTSWVCHPAASCGGKQASEKEKSTLKSLGIDCTLVDSSSSECYDTFDVTENAKDLLTWLYDRDETVVVVSGSNDVLQSLGSLLMYKGCESHFVDGEMRAVGVCF